MPGSSENAAGGDGTLLQSVHHIPVYESSTSFSPIGWVKKDSFGDGVEVNLARRSAFTTGMSPKALSVRQETKLITYLDEELLILSRHFETRRNPRAVLPTLDAYLADITKLQTLVLSIPPVPPSTDLRIAYHLQLMGLLVEAIRAYPIPHENHLNNVLTRFDRAWVTILRQQGWETNTNDSPSQTLGKSGSTLRGARSSEVQIRGTDQVRLIGLIESVKNALVEVFAGPRLVPLKIDPFATRVADPHLNNGTTEASPNAAGSSLATDKNLHEETSRSTDGDISMSADEAMSGISLAGEDASDGEESDDEFEEVEIQDLGPVENQTSFSIHIDPPSIAISPPPPPEFDIDPPQRRPAPGFDPDEEYGDTYEQDQGSMYSVNLEDLFKQTLVLLHQKV